MADPNNGGGTGRSLGGGQNNEPLPSSWSRSTNSGPRIGRIGNWSGSNAQSSGSSGRRLATLADLASSAPRSQHAHASDDDDDDDDDENSGEGESWFTGGERSGLSVQNPDHRSNIPGGDLVRGLLRKAAEAGPPPSSREESSSSRAAFSGSGFTLGSDEVESRLVPDANVPPTGSVSEETRAIRYLTLWRNGFSVHDGPLMRYDDPENAAILNELDRGQAPRSLLNVRIGEPVELRIAQRTNQDYEPPPLRGFDGSGHRLGAPAPNLAGGESSSSISAASTSAQVSAASSQQPLSVQTKFEVDQSQPTTSIQLRLADGTRMVCRMNLTHTVGDIRSFINASRPENLTRPYTVATTFPNRVLDDDTQTIESAGLKNSVVVQRWV